MKSRASSLIPLLSILCFLASCSVANRRSGVENVWRNAGVEKLEPNVSTTKEVLTLLGPPSQILDLGERMCFYYLLEHTDTRSLFLVVYNTSDAVVTYDRAVFFFDKKGVLEEMALSSEGLPTMGGEGEKTKADEGSGT